jgi:hypothetical protein
MKKQMKKELKSLKKVRNKTIKDLKKSIKTIWGPRCESHFPGCPTCGAWLIFDATKKLLDKEYYK